MNYPYLQAVMEVPWYDETSPLFTEQQPLWEFATELEAFSFLRLSAKSTNREIGLFISQLIECNQLECRGNIIDRLTEIIDYKSVEDEDYAFLSGGLEAGNIDLTISPGCCCGLETWREWTHFLSTGESPWMGHNPMSFIELINNRLVRVWIEKERGYIDFERESFAEQLICVQNDLVNFLYRVEAWSDELGFPDPKRLSAKLDRFFSISQEWQI